MFFKKKLEKMELLTFKEPLNFAENKDQKLTLIIEYIGKNVKTFKNQ